jgi:uncharacterized membrane protein
MFIKIRALVTAIAILGALCLSLPVYAACACNDQSTAGSIQCGAQNASGDCQSPAKAETDASATIKKLLNLFSAAVGVIAVIMLIIGGFRYITSAGDEAGAKSARNTIIYAIVGLVIVALAQFIVKFVITNTG